MTKHSISRRALVALTFFILFALGFHSPLQAARRHNYASLEKAHLAVWKVGAYTGPSNYYSGTAFAVRSNLFVTNSHVFQGLKRRGVSLSEIRLTQEGTSIKLQIDRILSLTDVYDLIFFRTKERGIAYLNRQAEVQFPSRVKEIPDMRSTWPELLRIYLQYLPHMLGLAPLGEGPNVCTKYC